MIKLSDKLEMEKDLYEEFQILTIEIKFFSDALKIINKGVESDSPARREEVKSLLETLQCMRGVGIDGEPNMDEFLMWNKYLYGTKYKNTPIEEKRRLYYAARKRRASLSKQKTSK